MGRKCTSGVVRNSSVKKEFLISNLRFPTAFFCDHEQPLCFCALQFNCLGSVMKIKTLILCIHAERSEACIINVMKTLKMKKAKPCSVTIILTIWFYIQNFFYMVIATWMCPAAWNILWNFRLLFYKHKTFFSILTVKNDAVEGVNRFLSYLFKQVSLLLNLQKAPVVGNMLPSNTFICSSFFQSSSAIKGDAIFAVKFVSFSSACQVCYVSM